MYHLSLPLPVARFLRQLFNVFSSLAVSNQYLLLQKVELEAGRETSAGSGAPNDSENTRIRSESLLNSELDDTPNYRNPDGIHYTRWSRLRLWNMTMRQSVPPRQAHSISFDQSSKSDSTDADLDEKYSPPKSAPPPSSRPPPSGARSNEPLSPIDALMLNPTLFDPVRKPRYPIVLCHGLYGYDVRGPSSFPILQLHYWANVLKVLKKKIGAEVIVTGVPGTGSIESRAERMDKFLRENAFGQDINFIAHSMGGLDCRHLISHVKPEEYRPASLTTICTPHRGSPFMDWCSNNIGIGKLRQQAKRDGQVPPDASNRSPFAFSLASLPSSFTTLLLSILDSPAYANLSTDYLESVFNPATPDDPRVRYYSVAARVKSMSVWHPLWLPKTVVDGVEAQKRAQCAPEAAAREQWGNDGLVSVDSARWGEFLGTLEGCDHWDVRGARGSVGRDGEWNMDLSLPSVVRNSLSDPLAHVNWRDWVAWWREEERKEEKELNRGRKHTRVVSQTDAEDAALKSSTDKLSAVFDWISEQVPLKKSSSAVPITASSKAAEEKRVDEEKAREPKDPRLKFDLERFYVALARKLYDDGL
ncbi:alpha/beta-hydrolase [Phellopilus nigrolimitatus]|nr:alpha/beta-hydrolase [Phellopilus nigrolimitatus]